MMELSRPPLKDGANESEKLAYDMRGITFRTNTNMISTNAARFVEQLAKRIIELESRIEKLETPDDTSI